MLELEIFRDVVKKLNSNNISYMISGSVAMMYYSIPRMTRDIDIVIKIEDIEGFYNTFKDEYYIDIRTIQDAVKNRSMFNIIHLKEAMKIDFIIRKDTEYRKIEFERRKQVEIDGSKVFIVTIEDLIISKLLWSRDSRSDFQINDIKNLLKEKIDVYYLDKWVDRLGITGFYREISGGE
jgi:predicted nucleotidyltransferase